MASLLGGQRRGGDGPQESVGHLGVYLQRRDPRSTTVLRPLAAAVASVALLPSGCSLWWAAAVARGAIAGASALLSSFEASSAVTLSSRDWMAAALLPEAAVFTARSVTCA